MPNYAGELRDFAYAKETTRGTAEAAPTKYLKIGSDSALNYEMLPVENDRIQGRGGMFPPDAGMKKGTGKLIFDLEAATVGDFLYSLLGSWTSSQLGTTTAYAHTFSQTTSNAHMSMSGFMDRDLQAYVYDMLTVKKLEVSGEPGGKAVCSADVLFQAEATTSTWSPTSDAPDPLMTHELSIKLTDAANTEIGKWSFSIDNQAEALWKVNGSQDAAEILAARALLIEGSLDMFFSSTTERNNFLANTTRKIEFIFTGGTITGTYTYKASFNFYDCRWSAFPWDGTLAGGLLGASAAFKGYYSVGDSKVADIVIQNTSTTY